jgi:Kef-type K+ transport system membrane component KefB
VESLRDRLGATSHSTPIDLLHNSGLLGLFLFYGSFLLLLPRLALRAASPERASISALIFATLICYMFASLSAIVHYNPFLGAFLGLSVGLLSPAAGQNRHGPAQ